LGVFLVDMNFTGRDRSTGRQSSAYHTTKTNARSKPMGLFHGKSMIRDARAYPHDFGNLKINK
jgi:hypothetical protein